MEKREFSTNERRTLARSGAAMSDGSFPIVSVGDLRNAIQAVGRAKNRSAALAHIKRRARALGRGDLVENLGKSAEWRVEVPIQKLDEEERLIFGWANVPHPVGKGADLGPPKIDLQDEMILLTDLERAAYEYVETSREGDEMHTAQVKAKMVESMVFTPEKMAAMGIDDWQGNYGWWVGYRVEPDAFELVKDGTYKMFSIGGTAKQVEV